MLAKKNAFPGNIEKNIDTDTGLIPKGSRSISTLLNLSIPTLDTSPCPRRRWGSTQAPEVYVVSTRHNGVKTGVALQQRRSEFTKVCSADR